LNQGFLGTAAPRDADLVLILYILMGAGLLIGGIRARKTVSASRQAPIRNRSRELGADRSDNDSFISSSLGSEDTARAWESVLRIGYGTRGAWNAGRNRCVVHFTRRGHESSGTQPTNNGLQAMDAQCAGALVARARVGIDYLYTLVRSEIVVEIDARRFQCARSQSIGRTARSGRPYEYFWIMPRTEELHSKPPRLPAGHNVDTDAIPESHKRAVDKVAGFVFANVPRFSADPENGKVSRLKKGTLETLEPRPGLEPGTCRL
jgi:hypothetical protein